MVQFHAKLSPLTPHHRHTLMLQNQQRWLKTEDQKMDILLIWSSVRECETVAHEQLWPDISMRWCWRCPIAQCAPLGGMCRWWENFNQFVTSPAQPSQPSPAQPSPAQPGTVMRDEKTPSSVWKCCVQCCEGPDFVQKVSLFMRNLEATVSVFLSKLARNNYSQQSAHSPSYCYCWSWCGEENVRKN